MPYALEKVLTVRALRENKALNRLVQCRTALSRAEDRKRRREQELAAYRQWRREEERRLFGRLRCKPASARDLDLFKDTVRSLRQEQADRTRQVEEANGRVAAAQAELHHARQLYAQACRRKSKIEEHKTIWRKIRRLNTERIEDYEMEEVGRSNPPI